MIIDLPNATVPEVSQRLLSVRQNVGAMALSRVLTLVVPVADAHVDGALKVVLEATRQHPSRIIVVVSANRRGSNRIDAQLRVGGDAGASEVVIMRLYGELTRHAESVVLPLLLADSPIVAWWPREAPKVPSTDPIGALAQRRVTDSEHAGDPARQISALAKAYSGGDTDLVWTRTTKWRALLAAALDQPPYESVQSAVVTGASDSAATDVLAGWLAAYLKCPVRRESTSPGSGLISVLLERSSGSIELERPDGKTATLRMPGQPERRLALPRRGDAECLADELTRLDPDEVYHKVLAKGLGAITKARSR